MGLNPGFVVTRCSGNAELLNRLYALFLLSYCQINAALEISAASMYVMHVGTTSVAALALLALLLLLLLLLALLVLLVLLQVTAPKLL